jgi:hypothetical protein
MAPAFTRPPSSELLKVVTGCTDEARSEWRRVAGSKSEKCRKGVLEALRDHSKPSSRPSNNSPGNDSDE